MVETKIVFFWLFHVFFYIKTYKSLIIIGKSNIYKTLQHNAL